MGRYVIRRLLWVVLVILVVTLITFVIFYVLPSDDPALRRVLTRLVDGAVGAQQAAVQQRALALDDLRTQPGEEANVFVLPQQQRVQRRVGERCAGALEALRLAVPQTTVLDEIEPAVARAFEAMAEMQIERGELFLHLVPQLGCLFNQALCAYEPKPLR